MSSSNSASSGGIGLAGFVFLIFLALKLAEVGVVATWSWWWVFSPLWIPLALVLLILACVGLVYGVAVICQQISKNSTEKRIANTRRTLSENRRRNRDI